MSATLPNEFLNISSFNYPRILGNLPGYECVASMAGQAGKNYIAQTLVHDALMVFQPGSQHEKYQEDCRYL